jgi:hypothetical protein
VNTFASAPNPKVGVVPRRFTREHGVDRMMKVIAPLCGHGVPAACLWHHHARIVEIAIEDQATWACPSLKDATNTSLRCRS